MLTFKETLKVADQIGITPVKLSVADNVECQLDACMFYNNEYHTDPIPYTENEFESVCYAVYAAYLKTEDYSIADITDIVCNELIAEGVPLEEIDRQSILERM